MSFGSYSNISFPSNCFRTDKLATRQTTQPCNAQSVERQRGKRRRKEKTDSGKSWEQFESKRSLFFMNKSSWRTREVPTERKLLNWHELIRSWLVTVEY